MNLGIRFDSFDPQSTYIDSLLNPEAGVIKSDKKNMWSPRIGVAYPITDEGVLHFSYGHFYQMPTMRNLFLTNIFGAGLSPTIGYSDLKPQKTVMYEFGMQQQLSRFIAINGSVFYKDIRDLLALQSINYNSPTYGPSSYAVYLNKDYSMVKGITLSLTKRRDPQTKTSAFIDYSYQTTEGNSVTSGSFYFNALTGEEEEKKIVPLGWDQSHVFNATVSVTEPGVNGWGLSFIGKLSTGWPYTPNIPFAGYVPLPNSDRKPFQQSLDMRLFKNFSLSNIGFELFLKVYNVLDQRNERYIFNDTGRSEYTFINRSLQETEGFKAHYGESGVHTWDEYFTRPDYFSPPRLITLGLSVNL
jgi:outer membrane receptor protein involved in Fe transport